MPIRSKVDQVKFIVLAALGFVGPCTLGLLPYAMAAGAYEAPCRNQKDAFEDAKKGLRKCIDSLDQTVVVASGDPGCLAELKDVNQKALTLRKCRSGK